MEETDEEELVEDLNIEFFALKYFTMSKLKQYKKDIEKMKKDSQEKDKKAEKEVERLQERIRELEEKEKVQKSAIEESSSEADESPSPHRRKIHRKKRVEDCSVSKTMATTQKSIETDLATPQLTRLPSTPKALFKVPQCVEDLSPECSEKLRDVIV
ncbi:hypothetical protein LOTGIDRAFT_175565 [Lottia gigantea]|uniref:Uncharacterized protein n=1 Tax=Lottia gigantea TaxID=225164 RepID=V4AIX3_LOTGI|nr:hypothetical protein LOTGIDRAFT_175565 [Lottia gigantea]ESO93441.1 hypothetical protein LOTGIDRAFT_175565 [Lottia gigantea]